MLRDIGDEVIPADVSRIWLDMATSPVTLVDAMRQDRSTRLRCSAINHLGRSLAAKDWQNVWDTLDAEQGIVKSLSRFSPYEVRHFTRAIGRSIRASQPNHAAKRTVVSKLYPHLRQVAGFPAKASPDDQIAAEVRVLCIEAMSPKEQSRVVRQVFTSRGCVCWAKAVVRSALILEARSSQVESGRLPNSVRTE
ncbi:hypothetical protein PHSY_005386 [Pseudozyma hubeiensis SY62]|uniref:Uncharacterized protein n=1 Tax=Pseudozyma hubeiensis (strain SY62) TaxID=1305764 RepID=R9P8X6_PSEHS|nr:hypothetical protein PHSY_005386 [Pseudozyma hubeiensis SY62]GAC97799.1 hypothetical protein PHSY_005386 [Pseudozyma hubeiensis SY62]